MQFRWAIAWETSAQEQSGEARTHLPASVICNSGLNYQVSFRPSSTLRLPPLKKVLFKNVGEATKM